MPETIAALNVLFFLLPGFLTQKIVESLTPPSEASEKEVVRDALVFALPTYFTYALFVWIGKHWVWIDSPFPRIPAVPFRLSGRGGGDLGFAEVLGIFTLIAVASGLGFVIAKASSEGWFYKILKAMKITRRSSHFDVWYDLFHDFNRYWLRVHLRDGTVVTGYADYFSDDPEKQEVLLAEAMVELPDGHQYLWEGPGIFLAASANIQRIEILPEGAQNAGPEKTIDRDRR